MRKYMLGLKECVYLICKFDKFLFVLLFASALIENMNVYMLNYINMTSINMISEKIKMDRFIKIFVILMMVFMIGKCLEEWIRPNISKKFIQVGMQTNYHIGKQYMKIPYHMIENPSFIKMSDKALRAVNSRMGISKAFESLQIIISAMISIVIWSVQLHQHVENLWICFCASLCFLVLSEYYLRSKMYDFENQLVVQNKEITYYSSLCSGIEYGKEIRMNRLHFFANYKIQLLYGRLAELWRKENNLAVKNVLINGCIYLSAYAYLSTYYLDLVIGKQIRIGEFLFYFGIISTYLLNIKILVVATMNIFETSQYFRDYVEFSNQVKQNISINETKRRINTINSVRFCNVSFKYPGTDEYILKNVSFALKKRESTALLGVNGSGKTTIINLLLGFYELNEGDIFINDISLKEIQRDDYIRLVSTVLQDDYLFALPISKNVTLSDDIDKTKLDKAFQKSQVTSVLCKLKNKENTVLYKVLEEDGVELSGGEGKKLCCARAMYKNAKLMICDEIAASLDIDTENKIYKMIRDYGKRNIIFFVSHRISTTHFCQKVIVLDKGSIVESGSPKELLLKKGLYYEMYKKECC